MAQATTTAAGEIVLSGDLVGSNDANFPELRASGVVPGHYALIQRATFDRKGRVVSVGLLDWATELAPKLKTATSTVNGIFSYSGNGLKETNGALTVELASNSAQGVFSIASNAGLVINAETVSVNTNQIIASDSVFGFIKVGPGFSYSNSTISIPNSTTTTAGAFSIDSGLSVSANVVSLAIDTLLASPTTFGFAKTGVGFTSAAGTISAANATGSALGIVKIGANITLTGNVASLKLATNSNKGIFSGGAGLNIVDGVVQTATNIARKNNANIFSKAQCGTKSVVSDLTIIPNFVTGPSMTEVTPTGNTVIEFPSVLAPAGTMVEQKIIINRSAGTAFSVTLSGSYKTNKNIDFGNSGTDRRDVLTLLCTDNACYAMLNGNFL